MLRRRFSVPAILAAALIHLSSGSAAASVDGASFSLKIAKAGTAQLSVSTTKGTGLQFLSVRSTTVKVNEAQVAARLGEGIGTAVFAGGLPAVAVSLPGLLQGHPEVITDKSHYTWWSSGPPQADWLAMSLRMGPGIKGPMAFDLPNSSTGMTLNLTAPLLGTSTSCKTAYSGTAYLTRFGAKPVTIPFSGRCS